MILYNATSSPTPQPRCGMILASALFGSDPRDTLPTDDQINRAIQNADSLGSVNASGTADIYALDDNHGMTAAMQASVLYRVKLKTEKPVGVYGVPSATAIRNLVCEWLTAEWSDSVWTQARDFATAPLWGPKKGKKKPFASFVDVLLPGPYCEVGVNDSTAITPLAAWRVVLDHTLNAARWVASLSREQPIYPFLHLTHPDVTADEILHALDLRGVEGAVVWGDSKMNAVLEQAA